MIPNKSEMVEMGTEHYLSECVEKIKSEFKLSNNQVAKALRGKASEINPPKRVAYCLPDGTEITKKEYYELKKIFPGKIELKEKTNGDDKK